MRVQRKPDSVRVHRGAPRAAEAETRPVDAENEENEDEGGRHLHQEGCAVAPRQGCVLHQEDLRLAAGRVGKRCCGVDAGRATDSAESATEPNGPADAGRYALMRHAQIMMCVAHQDRMREFRGKIWLTRHADL